LSQAHDGTPGLRSLPTWGDRRIAQSLANFIEFQSACVPLTTEVTVTDSRADRGSSLRTSSLISGATASTSVTVRSSPSTFAHHSERPLSRPGSRGRGGPRVPHPGSSRHCLVSAASTGNVLGVCQLWARDVFPLSGGDGICNPPILGRLITGIASTFRMALLICSAARRWSRHKARGHASWSRNRDQDPHCHHAGGVVTRTNSTSRR
jgi:hypothetical protein